MTKGLIMKRIFAALLPICMLIVFAGCGDGDASSDADLAQAPESASYFENKDHDTVVSRFKNAGFTNVKTQKVETS